MSTKFHISDDGVARVCNAQSVETCRATSTENSEHYDSIPEAEAAYEEIMKSSQFVNLKKDNQSNRSSRRELLKEEVNKSSISEFNEELEFEKEKEKARLYSDITSKILQARKVYDDYHAGVMTDVPRLPSNPTMNEVITYGISSNGRIAPEVVRLSALDLPPEIKDPYDTVTQRKLDGTPHSLEYLTPKIVEVLADFEKLKVTQSSDEKIEELWDNEGKINELLDSFKKAGDLKSYSGPKINIESFFKRNADILEEAKKDKLFTPAEEEFHKDQVKNQKIKFLKHELNVLNNLKPKRPKLFGSKKQKDELEKREQTVSDDLEDLL